MSEELKRALELDRQKLIAMGADPGPTEDDIFSPEYCEMEAEAAIEADRAPLYRAACTGLSDAQLRALGEGGVLWLVERGLVWRSAHLGVENAIWDKDATQRLVDAEMDLANAFAPLAAEEAEQS